MSDGERAASKVTRSVKAKSNFNETVILSHDIAVKNSFEYLYNSKDLLSDASENLSAKIKQNRSLLISPTRPQSKVSQPASNSDSFQWQGLFPSRPSAITVSRMQ